MEIAYDTSTTDPKIPKRKKQKRKVLASTTQRAYSNPSAVINTNDHLSIVQSANLVRFELKPKMLYLINDNKLSTSIPTSRLVRNANQLNIYNTRCSNPTHALLYNGKWWISNFRSATKEEEKKILRKQNVRSNGDLARPVRKILSDQGVICANTIQIFPLEVYIRVMKEMSLPGIKNLTNILKKHGKNNGADILDAMATTFSYEYSSKAKTIVDYPIKITGSEIRRFMGKGITFGIRDLRLDGESIANKVRALGKALIIYQGIYDIEDTIGLISFINSTLGKGGLRSHKEFGRSKYPTRSFGDEYANIFVPNKQVDLTEFDQRVLALGVPFRGLRNID